MNYNFLSGTTNLLVKDRCSSEQIPLPGWAQSIKQQTDATVFERDVFRSQTWRIYPKYGRTVLSPNKAYWEAGYEAYSVISRARLSC
ncbi:unnamed protein product [Musa acuminata subsp. burmannicoides]